jgi:hypothetical protein
MRFKPALIGVIMASGRGFSCPIYTTVTLKLFSTVYSPPLGSACTLKLLPCPYTPPTVI